ncbi:MAG: exonuclease domain-containing protein [Lentisphaeria bacterium]|nr:exonuclease domain-containing protein [Lentisphaeria bacterium]
MITVCSKCYQDFPITEELFGSTVECPICENQWLVQDCSIAYPPLVDIPDYTVIDIETTGLSPGKDRITEVAAQKVRNHQLVDSLETLVFPGCSIPRAVSQLTGIRAAMLKDAPLWHEVAEKIANFIDKEILVGHNIKDFDSSFLTDGFSRVMKTPPKVELVDTLEMSRDLIPSLDNHKLSTVCKAFGIESTYHRAMVDVDSTRQVFENLLGLAAKKQRDLYDYFSYPLMEPYKTTFDETNPLYGKNIVLAGEFWQLAREDVQVIIENMGGRCQSSVTMKTDILIICDGISNGSKVQKARQLKAKGQDIKAMNGEDFLRIYTRLNGGKLHRPPISRRLSGQEKQVYIQPTQRAARIVFRT